MSILSDKQILDGILQEFSYLAAIPRSSKHEEAVSNFLKERAESFGCTAMQDDRFNLIIDKAAAPGCEAWPQVLLQAHMDMVCVAAEGVDYDPLTSPIKLINDGEYLHADGTSLGADDGIGVATGMFLLQQNFKHGPLRLIFTVDEEVGMTGARHLDASFVKNARYMINCDSEAYDVLTLSCAGSASVETNRRLQLSEPKFKQAYRFSIRGLHGGHSGEAINRGYANAIKLMGKAIYDIKKSVDIELASMQSLRAHNVIPSEAEFVFTTRISDAKIFDNIAKKLANYIAHAYANIETKFEIICEPTTLPDKVMSNQDRDDIVNFINLAPTGVMKMSQAEAGLVELSANMGPVKVEGDQFTLSVFPRSAVDALLMNVCDKYRQLAHLCNLNITVSEPTPGWPVNPDSKLKHIALEVFQAQNGKPMKAESIHAGLECSFFYAKNNNLDIVSVGPNNLDIHSPKERLELRTVVPHVQLIIGILSRLDG